MNPIFGIHIGNTNATLAICKENGQSEIIVNDAGDRVTSAAVLIAENETVVGTAAKTAMVSRGKFVICCNKKLLSMDKTDNENISQFNGIPIIMRNNYIHYSIPIEEKIKYITAKTITSCICRKLHNIAKSSRNISEEILPCVLLVPEYWSDASCEVYKSAAEEVGWKVMQIINETSAAALAYSLLDTKEPSELVLVYRLGGLTCEVVAYSLCEGMLHKLDSEHNEDIGGSSFPTILADYLADEFFKSFKLDARENKRSMWKLKQISENCVHTLSKAQTAHCFIESLHDGVDFSLTISRARFELLIQPILAKLTEPLRLLLERLQTDEPVDRLILCGGATNTPKLRSYIASLFDPSVTQILTHINADEVLALGAAKQAHCLLDNEVTEFLPRSIQIPVDSLMNLDTTHYSEEEN